MIQKLYHITVFFFHIIKKQRPFSNPEFCSKVVVFQGSQVIFHPLRSPSKGFSQAWRLAPFYPDHFNPHLNTFGNATITLTFEHRHENKSYSVCLKDHFSCFQLFRFSKHSWLVPSFCLTFRHFLAGNQLHELQCQGIG